MSMDRLTIALYLDEQFSGMAEAIGQDADIEEGYRPDIDNALRKLNTAESDLATAAIADASRDGYFALAEYYAARRFWRQLGNRVNNRTGLNSYDFDGQRKQAKEMMEDAKTRCGALGYDVSGTGWGVGNLNLDWLEPELTVGA